MSNTLSQSNFFRFVEAWALRVFGVFEVSVPKAFLQSSLFFGVVMAPNRF